MKKISVAAICIVFLSSLVLIPFASADSYTLVWKSNLSYPERPYKMGVSWSYPIVVDGIVYVSSNGAFLNVTTTSPPYPIYPFSDIYALNATNSAVVWDYQDNSSSNYDSPAVDNGILFFGSTSGSDNYFGALNAANGLSLWNYTLGGEGWEITSSPVVANGVVYIGAFNGLSGGLYALNENNGDEIWIFPIYGGVASSPNVVNGVVYVGSRFSNNIYALDATNGERLWNYTLPGEPTSYAISTPAVSNGVVYVGSNVGNLYALNAANGVKLWNYGVGNGVFSPVVVNDTVYVLSTDPLSVYAIKATDGSKVWNSSLVEGTVFSSLVVDSGIVYVSVNNPTTSNEAGIYALNAYDGEQLWTLPMPSYPAVIDGILYFGYSGGQVYAYSVSPIPFPTPTTNSPSPSVPEFPSAFIGIAVLMAAIVVVALIARKRIEKMKKINLENACGNALRFTADFVCDCAFDFNRVLCCRDS